MGTFPKGSVNTWEKNALRIYVYNSTVHHSKNKEPGRRPSIGEKIDKSVYTVEFYTAIKKNEIMAHAEKWAEPDPTPNHRGKLSLSIIFCPL